MDKAEFIRIAPTYYYAAVATALKGTWGHFTISSLRRFYAIEDVGDVYLEHDEITRLALDKLFAEGAISELSDPFGEPLYQKTELFDKVIEKIETDTSGPYYKNKTANDYNQWMRGALFKVNDQYRSLFLTPADFARELPDEWAPIQINPSEPAVQEAVRQLQEATTAIEQDNGYAATYPQERDQVVQDLKGGLDKLKSDAVSIGWLRRTVDALKTAGSRFANTAKGQMIDGALAAIKDVIKHHIGSALEGLWSFFF
jgi:hypothetical protein